MHNKSKSNLLQILCLVAVFFSLLSCKKEEPPKFSGENFLFFESGHIVSYSSWVSLYNKDAIKSNIDDGFPLTVQMDGKLSDKDRPFLIQLEGNGKEYVIMPHPDSLYIKANKIQYQLNLSLVRPPLSDTAMKTVTLILKNNDPFKPEHHISHKVTYKFGNWFDEPLFYDIQKGVFGGFSAAKMYTMQEAVNRKGTTYWESNPNVITLNNYVKERGGTPLKFNPFTFNDLYNFIDNQVIFDGIITGPLSDAYTNVHSEMIALSKALLIEKRNTSHPVLDNFGNEISFP